MSLWGWLTRSKAKQNIAKLNLDKLLNEVEVNLADGRKDEAVALLQKACTAHPERFDLSTKLKKILAS